MLRDTTERRTGVILGTLAPERLFFYKERCARLFLESSMQREEMREYPRCAGLDGEPPLCAEVFAGVLAHLSESCTG